MKEVGLLSGGQIPDYQEVSWVNFQQDPPGSQTHSKRYRLEDSERLRPRVVMLQSTIARVCGVGRKREWWLLFCGPKISKTRSVSRPAYRAGIAALEYFLEHCNNIDNTCTSGVWTDRRSRTQKVKSIGLCEAILPTHTFETS